MHLPKIALTLTKKDTGGRRQETGRIKSMLLSQSGFKPLDSSMGLSPVFCLLSPVSCLLTIFSITLSLGMVTTTGLATQVQALPLPGGRGTTVNVTFDPPEEGEPKDTSGGASRDGGTCPQDSKALKPYVTLLMPATNHGLTAKEHPTFFVYVPQTSAQKAFFSLQDENNNHHYQTSLPITGKPGVVSFRLPADAPALKIGTNYKWSFVLMCKNVLRPDSPRVEGRIRRMEPNPALISQIKNAAPLERAALLGSDGIWYDTLAVLAELRRSQPDDLTLVATWEKLLNSVGLNAIATKPLEK